MIKSLLKDSFIYSLSSFFSKGIGFILLPFYTNVFSPSDYGVIDMIAISVVLITNIVSMQINQSLFRYYSSSKSVRKKTAYFSTTLFYYAISYFIVSSSLFLSSTEISLFLFESHEYANILKIASINIFITSHYYIVGNFYRLNFESKKFALLSLANTVFTALIIILMVLFFQLGLIGIFLGQLIVNAFSLLYVMIKLFHHIDLKLVSFKLLRQMLRFSLPLVPTVLILLAMQYIDRIMISKMIGIESLGLYAVALKVSSVIGLILSGFQLAWGPYIFNQYSKPETKEIVADLFYYINILSLILVSFLVLFSSDILRLLTNQSFYAAYTVVPLLALSTLFFFIGSSFSIGFSIANRNEVQTVIYLFTIVINVFLNYVLISDYGIYGAAIATMISFFISGLLNLYFSNKYYNIFFKIKKLSIYIINFLVIVVLYNLYIQNNLTTYDYMVKFILLCSWILVLIVFEKDLFKKLKIFKK